MILKIFVQPNCSKCPAAKKMGEEIKKLKISKLKVEFWDTSGIDGLAEASFYSVFSTPSLILCDKKGKEIKGWRGKTPTIKEIKSLLR